MNIKSIAVGLLFGVGMALALKSWLLGIMFGIIFYVSLNEAENKKLTKWNTSAQIKLINEYNWIHSYWDCNCLCSCGIKYDVDGKRR